MDAQSLPDLRAKLAASLGYNARRLWRRKDLSTEDLVVLDLICEALARVGHGQRPQAGASPCQTLAAAPSYYRHTAGKLAELAMQAPVTPPSRPRPDRRSSPKQRLRPVIEENKGCEEPTFPKPCPDRDLGTGRPKLQCVDILFGPIVLDADACSWTMRPPRGEKDLVVVERVISWKPERGGESFYRQLRKRRSEKSAWYSDQAPRVAWRCSSASRKARHAAFHVDLDEWMLDREAVIQCHRGHFHQQRASAGPTSPTSSQSFYESDSFDQAEQDNINIHGHAPTCPRPWIHRAWRFRRARRSAPSRSLGFVTPLRGGLRYISSRR